MNEISYFMKTFELFSRRSVKTKSKFRNIYYYHLRNADYLYIPDEPSPIFIYDRFDEGGGCVYLHNIVLKKTGSKRGVLQSRLSIKCRYIAGMRKVKS